MNLSPKLAKMTIPQQRQRQQRQLQLRQYQLFLNASTIGRFFQFCFLVVFSFCFPSSLTLVQSFVIPSRNTIIPSTKTATMKPTTPFISSTFTKATCTNCILRIQHPTQQQQQRRRQTFQFSTSSTLFLSLHGSSTDNDDCSNNEEMEHDNDQDGMSFEDNNNDGNTNNPQSIESESSPRFQVNRDSTTTSATTFDSSSSESSSTKYDINLLLIDHYDSFTYNLYDMLAQLTVRPPIVIAKDALPGYKQQQTMDKNENKNKYEGSSLLSSIDGIVLSPGPGTPEEQPPLSHEAITENPNLPILGVCLGHQLLALNYGGTVDKAPKPIHGQDHWITQTTTTTNTGDNLSQTDNNNNNNNDKSNHDDTSSNDHHYPTSKLFVNTPESFRVVRYHSLAATKLPSDNTLRVTATSTSDGVIQAMEHITNPHYGVQFHPESIGSQYGMTILNNFCNIVQENKKAKAAERKQKQQQMQSLLDETNKEEMKYCSDDDNNNNDKASSVEDQSNQSNERSKLSSSSSSPPPAPRFRVLLYPLPQTRRIVGKDDNEDNDSSNNMNELQPLHVFSEFYSDQSTAMWLDSSSYPSRGSLDIMAAPLSDNDILEYHLPKKENHDKTKTKDGTSTTSSSSTSNKIIGSSADKDILTQLEERLAFAYDMDIGLVSNDFQDIDWTKDTAVASSPTSSQPMPFSVHDIPTTSSSFSSSSSSGTSSNKNKEQQKKHRVLSIPFDYRGGYLGYLGYEVRHDTQKYLKERESFQSSSSSYSTYDEKENNDLSPMEPLKYDPEGTSNDTNDDSAASSSSSSSSASSPSVPTAAFFLARESMIYHHPTKQWYLLGLIETENEINDSKARTNWMQRTVERMESMRNKMGDGDNDTLSSVGIAARETTSSSSSPLAFVPNRPKGRYTNDIAKCHEYIKMGESYELCLTNQLEATVLKDVSPSSSSATTATTTTTTLDLYRRLRRRNPAPYSAYFTWKGGDMAICCSSPERFMSVRRIATNNHPYKPTTILQAEAKPIKGTCARVLPRDGIRRTEAETREDERRARSLELSLKNRAENLMIVDLLRNDMSRVCKIGSVHVAKLMDIESFATVHQMVSTIRGTLVDEAEEEISTKTKSFATDTTVGTSTGNYNEKNGKTSATIELLRASFPGGSMTGAPKIRTMELLEELEDDVDRGPYSGSLGYLSINACMDMNIIIRSAVVVSSDRDSSLDDHKSDEDGNKKKQREYRISIGAGGAITALSEAQDEYDEMLLKARAVVESVQEWAAATTTPSASPIVNTKGGNGKEDEKTTLASVATKPTIVDCSE